MKFKKREEGIFGFTWQGFSLFGVGVGVFRGGVRGDKYDHILHIYICILVGQLGHSAKPLPFLASC